MSHRILFLRESVAYLALRLRSPDPNWRRIRAVFACLSLQRCLPNAGRLLMHPGRSGNTEASKDRNFDNIQDCTESSRGSKLRGDDRNGQWRHCDSKGCES